MGLLFDKYVPQEGFNTIFSDIKNCDIEVRPSKEGFQAPLFFIKKRTGLKTKSGVALIYKGTTLDQPTGATYIDASTNYWGLSGYKIQVNTQTRIQTVSKIAECTAIRCHILDATMQILVTKDFVGTVATFNRIMTPGTYYVVVDSNNLSYASRKNSNMSYPVSNKLINYLSGLYPGDLVTATTNVTYWTGYVTYVSYDYRNKGWRLRAKKDIIINSVTKNSMDGNAGSVNIHRDNGTLIASANFSGNVAQFTSSAVIVAGEYFRIETSTGGYWRYRGARNMVNTPIVSGDVEFISGSVSNTDDLTYGYNIDSIVTQQVNLTSLDAGYSISKIVAEDNMVASSEGQRDTIGDIMGTSYFDNKAFMYTKEGYIYSFDGTTLSVVLANKKNVYASTSNTEYVLNNQQSKVKQAQEFTPTANVVLKSIDVKIKTTGTVPVSALMKCTITDGDNKDTIISISKTVLDKTGLNDTYQIKNFAFDNVLLTGSKKYCFYVEVFNTYDIGYFNLSGAATGIYALHKSYVSNSGGTWVENPGTMWFSCNMTAPLTLKEDNYDQGITQVSYIGGGRYPDDTVEYTVSTYDDTTGIITFNESVFNTTYIGKYVYISSGGVAKYQQRAISDCSATNKLTLAVGLQLNAVSGDKVQIFNSMESQLWFPQLRKGTADADLKWFYSYDLQGNQRYMYFPEKRKIISWDNRIVQLTKDKQALIASSSIDYEIPITVSVTFGNSQALSMAVYGGYLMVFFANKIGLVKKDIIDSSTGEFAYIYQDLLDVGLYSENSFIVQGGNLYIFANDKRLYSVDLSTISLGEIIAKLSDQGQVLLNYFNAFVGGDVRMFYNSGILYVVYRGTNGLTKIFKYMETFKSWITDEYEYSGNFFNFLYSIGQKRFTLSGNRIYEMTGTRDGDKKIVQHLKLYGPIQGLFDLFTLIMVKLRLGFDGLGIGGTVKTTIGGYKKFQKEWDLESIAVIKEINAALASDGSMGSDQYGNVIYGGEGENFGRLQDIYSEMLDISFKVGKKGSYFTIELTNDTDKQLMVGGVIPYYNTDNPLFTYNKGVLK